MDEPSILVCGIYVDLNQIRAGEALTPESSNHTSAYDRIQARQSPATSAAGWLCELTLVDGREVDRASLLQSATGERATDKGLLPISLDEYLRLLDASGRMVQEGKLGAISPELAPILERLSIEGSMWGEMVGHFDRMFGSVVGASTKVA